MLNVSSASTVKTKGPVFVAEELTDEERKVLKNLVEVLDTFMLERPNIPAYYIAILLRIALDEGKPQKHYRDTMGYPSSTMSRSMLALGTRAAEARDSMGLIDERQASASLREYEVLLSTKGRSLVKRIAKKLRGEK